MLKKRLAFALLWDGGHFSLSRNFRLQRVGDYAWLTKQYRFEDVAQAIDELFILDVTRGPRQSEAFLQVVSSLAESLQIPVAVGGGLRTLRDARGALKAGADKLVFNSGAFTSLELLMDVGCAFGRQCIVVSLDLRRCIDGYDIYVNDGKTRGASLLESLESPVVDHAGELLVNSIDLDGTGNGLDLGIPDLISSASDLPLVLMGGTGQPSHVISGLLHSRVDAVCTSNLLNFIGDGLSEARAACIAAGISIPNRLSAQESRDVGLV